jgi:hypothetical protein
MLVGKIQKLSRSVRCRRQVVASAIFICIYLINAGRIFVPCVLPLSFPRENPQDCSTGCITNQARFERCLRSIARTTLFVIELIVIRIVEWSYCQLLKMLSTNATALSNRIRLPAEYCFLLIQTNRCPTYSKRRVLPESSTSRCCWVALLSCWFCGPPTLCQSPICHASWQQVWQKTSPCSTKTSCGHLISQNHSSESSLCLELSCTESHALCRLQFEAFGAMTSPFGSLPAHSRSIYRTHNPQIQ